MNYLASPPLVVAYALAGRMDVDVVDEPLGEDTTASRSTSATSGRHRRRCGGRHRGRRTGPGSVRAHVRRGVLVPATRRGASCPCRAVTSGREVYNSRPTSSKPPYFAGMTRRRRPRRGHHRGASYLVSLGDSVTTDRAAPPRGLDPTRTAPCRPIPRRARRRAEAGNYRSGTARGARRPRGDGARHVRERPPAEPARARLGHGRCTCLGTRCRSSRRPSAPSPKACRRSSSPQGSGRARPATGAARRPDYYSAYAPRSPELRADPPLNLLMMGILPLRVRAGRESRVARPDRPRDVLGHGGGRRGARGGGCARPTPSSARCCGSTRRASGEAPSTLRHGGILPYVLRSCSPPTAP